MTQQKLTKQFAQTVARVYAERFLQKNAEPHRKWNKCFQLVGIEWRLAEREALNKQGSDGCGT
jgi:hypothetical protein